VARQVAVPDLPYRYLFELAIGLEDRRRHNHLAPILVYKLRRGRVSMFVPPVVAPSIDSSFAFPRFHLAGKLP